jgi:hypothetical protein
MAGGKGKAYSFPLKAFYQNQVDIRCSGAGDGKYQLQLTGLRNGEVRSIFFWVTKDVDVLGKDASGNVNTSAPFTKNFTSFVLPKDIELLYNGTVYYRARDIGAQMWNLITTETPPVLQNTLMTIPAGAGPVTITTTSVPANWVEIPFSQVFEQLSGSHMYVAGKLIQNAVVNLNVELPDSASYTLHAVYGYNSALMFADKGCEYVF